jgi:glycosyltransferase involved in cell wall biosynthesis
VTNGSRRAFDLGDDLTVIIPTMNSGKYIDIILRFYEDHGIPVTVFVDDRSVDDTLAIVKRAGTKAVLISNPAPPFVESLIEPMSRLCLTKWLLRLDDDELPTLAMMEFIRDSLRESDLLVQGFHRHECAVSCNGRLLSHSQVSPYEHRQWRFYQTDKVRFAAKLHTPGFEWEGMGGDGAPPEVPMIHLDWALHSYEERRRKVKRYEAHCGTDRPSTGAYLYYLYEDQPWSKDCFQNLDYPEFEKPCLEISRRFRNLCVDV